jgi:hypothetical protein
MAALTDIQYGEIHNLVYRQGQGKEELKAHPTLPDQAHLKAAYQVLENFWEDNKAAVKAALDTALGVTTTGAEAKKIGLQFLIWKASKGG